MSDENAPRRGSSLRCCGLALLMVLGPPALLVLHLWLVGTLHAAIARGDLGAISRITLVDRWTINSPTDIDPLDNYPAFFCAASNGRADIVKLLIRRGGSVKWRAWNGETPLHAAVQSKSVRTAKLMIDHGADINARDSAEITPLHRASELGLVAMVRLLADSGADLSPKNSLGETPLDCAITDGSVAIARLLQSRGAKTTLPLVVRAAAEGDAGTLRRELGRDPGALRRRSARNWTLMQYAVLNGHDGVVALLLSRGAVASGELLLDAVSSGNRRLVSLLVRHGIGVNSTMPAGGYASALHCAVDENDMEMVQHLLSLGADTSITYLGKTPEESARSQGHSKIADAIGAWKRAHPRGTQQR